MSSAPSTVAPDRIRLHITPFNPDIYDRVVSSSAKATATGVSYHSVQTQPEKGFGYIELPKMEVEKLKKKLHGSTLKGSKVRVEEAKPEKKRKAEGDETEEERKERKKAKKAKKAKREEGVIPGYELEDGRHVKRGWSEGNDKTSDKKSKDGKKMRFKTEVPPNAMPLEEDDKKKKKSKDKKAKRDSDKDGDRKSHKTPKVVEEFAKKKGVMISAESDSKGALEYVEGQGWVNEAGEVVEAEPLSVRRQRAKEEARKVLEEARKAKEEQAQEELRQAEAMAVDAKEDAKSEDEASADQDMADSDDDHDDNDNDASDSASSTSEDGDSEKEGPDEPAPTTATTDHVSPAPKPSKSAGKLATPVPEAEREVHPLEALYKRAPQTEEGATKHSLPPINTSFSFFSADDIEDEDEPAAGSVSTHQPQTPHTKQDLEWRALRSAAPTPDTAGLGKRFKFAMGGAENDDGSDEDEDEEMADVQPTISNADSAVGDGEPKEESDFRKWFYEHRGDNNRAWKKKRKEAKKQQRQRENRRLSRRVV